MKTVTFEEYRSFVGSRRDLRAHITDGKEISACQWVDADNVVQAQSIYQSFQPIGLVSKTYQIREN